MLCSDGFLSVYLPSYVQARHPMLVGAVGTIDSLKLPIQVSSNSQLQNSMYNGWLHLHFVSNVFAFSPTGKVKFVAKSRFPTYFIPRGIIYACLNAPGSWHDSRVARPLYDTLAETLPVGHHFVADTAFPQGTGRCPGKIQTPLHAGSALPDNPEELSQVVAFNQQLISYRQSVE